MKGKSGWFFQSRRHSLASRGVSTPQRLNILSRLNQRPSKNKGIATIRTLRFRMLKLMYGEEFTIFGNPEVFKPFLGQFSEKDSHYIAGDVFYAFADKIVPTDNRLHTYLREVKGDMDKDDLHKLIYSKDSKIQKEVRDLDMEIMDFLSKNQDFKYKVVNDKEGNERLITWSPEFKKQNLKLFKELVVKVKNE